LQSNAFRQLTVVLAFAVLSHLGSCVFEVGEFAQLSDAVLLSISCKIDFPAKFLPLAVTSTVIFLVSLSSMEPREQRMVRRSVPVNEQTAAAAAAAAAVAQTHEKSPKQEDIPNVVSETFHQACYLQALQAVLGRQIPKRSMRTLTTHRW
jgi:hypothetical protein